VKQIKIRDKEYNCSNMVYYHIQGLKSENRVISMELLGHENNELQQQKEIERLNNIINEFDDFITNVDCHINLGDESEEFILVRDKWLELQELKGVDKE